MSLGQHEYTDGADLIANLPYHNGHSQDPDQYNEFIKKAHAKVMPSYITEKATAFNSGVVQRVTDNVPVRNDVCNDELGDPTEYVCAPADNCVDETLTLEKNVIQKSSTINKTLTIDPFCDDDTAMEITQSGGVLKFALLKMREIAYSISRFENRTAFTALAAETGAAASLTSAITVWDEDNAVEQFDCVIADIADTLKIDMSDLVVFSSHKGKRPIETVGKLINSSHMRAEMETGFFSLNNGYVGDYSGLPWFADGNFPNNKIFIGMKGALRYWDSATMFSQREAGCNHGVTNIWSKKYTTYVPCDMQNKFVILDLPAGC